MLVVSGEDFMATKKTTKNKRNLRKPAIVDATNVKNMKKILPYM